MGSRWQRGLLPLALAGAVAVMTAGSAGVAYADSQPGPQASSASDVPSPTISTVPPSPDTTTAGRSSAPSGVSRTDTASSPSATTSPSSTSSARPATSTEAIPTPTAPSSGRAAPTPRTVEPRAVVASDPIEDRYSALGGAGGVLGAVSGTRQAVGAGQVQAYAHGHIWWSASTGAWETVGSNDTRFTAVGSATGPLGFPSSGQRTIANGTWQWFQGGTIWWSAPTGSYETTGAIGARYQALQGPWKLGFPTGAASAIAGGQWQVFTGGVLWWSAATGAYETTGAISTRYTSLSGPWHLGFPRSPAMSIAGGQWQWFQGGTIWWSARSGAWETTGPMGARYQEIQGPWTIGFPTSAAMRIGDGWWQWFTGGVVWWSWAGAWETYGVINSQYVSLQGPWSWYRFPIGAPYAYLGGQRQDFQGGSLLSGASPVLDATYSAVGPGDVWATWRAGCPVGPASLTLVRLNYWGFDSAVHRGEIIVRSDLAGRVASVFATALADRYPIRSMWRVDYYGGSDPTSMAADNTSGFNCRQVTGGTGLSPHSYGIAIDVNTLENPYYAGGRWWPNADYTNRSVYRWGMLYPWAAVNKAFAANGYAWGGSYLDYQHFQYVG